MTTQAFTVRSMVTRSLMATAALAAALVLGVMAAQPAAAAGSDPMPAGAVGEQQTVPEPAQPETPGEGLPGDGAAPGSLPEGESAVADGGAATPWVIGGLAVLLLLALLGAVWASRKPRAMDLDGTAPATDPTLSDHRYIPPGM